MHSGGNRRLLHKWPGVTRSVAQTKNGVCGNVILRRSLHLAPVLPKPRRMGGGSNEANPAANCRLARRPEGHGFLEKEGHPGRELLEAWSMEIWRIQFLRLVLGDSQCPDCNGLCSVFGTVTARLLSICDSCGFWYSGLQWGSRRFRGEHCPAGAGIDSRWTEPVKQIICSRC